MKYVDLSVPINNTLMVYPGDPVVDIGRFASIEKGGVNLTEMKIGSHAGTHVDLPLHCIPEGADASQMPLEAFFGEAAAVSAHILPDKTITADDTDLSSVRKGDILLLSTGWEKKFGSDAYFIDIPSVNANLAEKLVKIGIKALGIDIPSVDNADSELKTHKILLGNGIVIFECLINITQLIGKRFYFYGVPLKICGGDGSPVRAFAIIP
jgi:arylformamidase